MRGMAGTTRARLASTGFEEKDVVLDVALRLGKLLHDRLGAEIIYTRSDDTFIPLETRTAIANKAQADLFLSIHANSSPDASARGVETYYLNFTSSPDALETAARENAVSDQSIHQLSDLVKKIALKDKIEESREFASDVEASLYGGLQKGNAGLKDRGVKKAPFVVLIGANMPSILAEISFVTNEKDARQLQEPEYRAACGGESLQRCGEVCGWAERNADADGKSQHEVAAVAAWPGRFGSRLTLSCWCSLTIVWVFLLGFRVMSRVLLGAGAGGCVRLVSLRAQEAKTMLAMPPTPLLPESLRTGPDHDEGNGAPSWSGADGPDPGGRWDQTV